MVNRAPPRDTQNDLAMCEPSAAVNMQQHWERPPALRILTGVAAVRSAVAPSLSRARTQRSVVSRAIGASSPTAAARFGACMTGIGKHPPTQLLVLEMLR